MTRNDEKENHRNQLVLIEPVTFFLDLDKRCDEIVLRFCSARAKQPLEVADEGKNLGQREQHLEL